MEYSFVQGLVKACKYIVIFGLPVLVDRFVVAYPGYAQLTVGGLLVLLVNFIKIRYSK